ncbi:MAG: S41 family peptidase, partial [Lentisphaeria bacterium]
MLRIATLFYAAVLLLPPPGNICMGAAADNSHTAQTADANSDSVQADDAQAVTDKPASPPPPLMQKTIREVLDKLASEKLLDPASAKQTDTILKALTETLGSSVKYLPPGTEQNYNEALAEAKKRSGNGGGLKITEVGKNTAYCRIPTFNEHNTEQLQQFLDQLGGDPYQAAVFDLRFSGGSSYNQAVATGKILQNTQSPAAIIINGETSGAAEVFVSIAKQQSKTVLIGQPSRGIPFRLE